MYGFKLQSSNCKHHVTTMLIKAMRHTPILELMGFFVCPRGGFQLRTTVGGPLNSLGCCLACLFTSCWSDWIIKTFFPLFFFFFTKSGLVFAKSHSQTDGLANRWEQKNSLINMLHIRIHNSSKPYEFTPPFVPSAACFGSGTQMDSSEWH